MRLITVDVFTQTPLTGNPAAVILDADGLDAATMQRIARETNLSETVFVLPPAHPDADYRVRIFTPRVELAFAGHPTIGTAHVLRSEGLARPDGRIVQECGAGLVPIDLEDGANWLTAPPASCTPCEAAPLETMLGVTVRRAADVDCGIVWRTAEVDDVSEVDPDLTAIARTGVDVTIYSLRPHVRVRSFAPAAGIAEDPVCGSGNVCVAAMLRDAGELPGGGRYTATQGDECGRPGRVEVEVRDDVIRIGGHAVTVLDGTLRV